MQASIVFSVDVIKVRIKASAASQQSTAIKNRPKEQKVLLKGRLPQWKTNMG